MKQYVFIALVLVFASTSFARFSEFVLLTPDTETKHKMSVSVTPMNNDHALIKFKWNNQHQRCWLIVFKDDQSVPDKLDFRDIVWNRQSTLPAGVAQLIPLPNNRDEFVEVILQQSLIPHAFICIDYPSMVVDGGYYYTMDLSTYFKKLDNPGATIETEE